MKKYSMGTIVGIFVTAGPICVGYMAVKLGDFSLLAVAPQVFYARFNSVSVLKVGSPIEIFGIQVGNVEKIDTAKGMALVRVHPEMKDFWMELSAVSMQHSAKDLLFLVFADSRQLVADRAHRKTAVFGWRLVQIGLKNGIMVCDDAIASLKTAGLIGDKFIQVDPAGSEDLRKPGGTITETLPVVDPGDLIGRYAFGAAEAPGEKKEKK